MSGSRSTPHPVMQKKQPFHPVPILSSLITFATGSFRFSLFAFFFLSFFFRSACSCLRLACPSRHKHYLTAKKLDPRHCMYVHTYSTVHSNKLGTFFFFWRHFYATTPTPFCYNSHSTHTHTHTHTLTYTTCTRHHHFGGFNYPTTLLLFVLFLVWFWQPWGCGCVFQSLAAFGGPGRLPWVVAHTIARRFEAKKKRIDIRCAQTANKTASEE